MQGTRLPDALMGEPGQGWVAWENGGSPGSPQCSPGSYMKVTTRTGSVMWFIVDPLGAPGTIVKQHHQVEEHEDGTITVLPSLDHQRDGYDHESFAAMITKYPFGWHGWLEHGIWKEC